MIAKDSELGLAVVRHPYCAGRRSQNVFVDVGGGGVKSSAPSISDLFRSTGKTG